MYRRDTTTEHVISCVLKGGVWNAKWLESFRWISVHSVPLNILRKSYEHPMNHLKNSYFHKLNNFCANSGALFLAAVTWTEVPRRVTSLGVPIHGGGTDSVQQYSCAAESSWLTGTRNSKVVAMGSDSQPKTGRFLQRMPPEVVFYSLLF